MTISKGEISKLRIGQILRDPRSKSAVPAEIERFVIIDDEVVQAIDHLGHTAPCRYSIRRDAVSRGNRPKSVEVDPFSLTWFF